MRALWIVCILCVISLAIKLIFMPDDFGSTNGYPNDGFRYYTFAYEIVHDLKHEVNLRNIGLPLLASPFIFFFPFHQTLIIFSLVVSVLVIPISFIFFRKYLDVKFSLIAVFLLSFDYRIIQNSLMGITEPFILFFGLLSLLVRDYRLAFFFAGVATMIRFEAVIFVLFLSGMYFYKRQRFTRYPILFFMLPLVLVFVFNNDFLSHNMPNLEIVTSSDVKGSPLNTFIHLGWAMIPFFALAPVGLLRAPHLAIPCIILLLPGFYTWQVAFDYRYFFLAYPFFAVLSALGMKMIISKLYNRHLP